MTRTSDAPEGARNADEPPGRTQDKGEDSPAAKPKFILYLDGPEYQQELYQLVQWTHHVLLPVYGREVTSTAPWCSRWWEHPGVVAQLHGLWLAWSQLTGPDADLAGPASWHRDFLGPVMGVLRDPAGPFAGCKPGYHRPKEVPPVDQLAPPQPHAA
ncbi:DUF4913 domain-containing protein [Streptomyces smyrnaeus]|uniref:DUF4913 domain-containing protein n=1 Tax=Streptomyces smyrnaeus TaxID=1387713 RepID=A0ABS3XPF0_9ACTN|nr:DUF4913 domain-containing protein [Streptomyces smyrnaeus]MBO8197278.1 DUF4913 domain-containing protein [Streptomyces smyrnaeus]